MTPAVPNSKGRTKQISSAYAPLFPYLPLVAESVLAPNEIVIDSFSGIGGASGAIEQVIGRPVDHAINHNPSAVEMHLLNNPYTHHHLEDVWHVNPLALAAGKKIALLWLSPDCFPTGTLVLTERGYMPIEQVQVGDQVLTHRQRWRKVVQVSQATRPLMKVSGHGHPGLLVSPEHPFYVREGKHGDATWAPASVLGKGMYWATPTRFGTEQLPVPLVPGRGMELDCKLAWLIGQYLGNGWTRLTDKRAELVLTVNPKNAEVIRAKLDQWTRKGERSGENELAWHGRATSTAYQFSTDHRGLVEWLRDQFGHLAPNKRVPGWALQLPPELRNALLAGYLEADGYTTETFTECNTVSRALAYSIKGLAASLGKTVTLYQAKNQGVIQGREVNVLPLYHLRWRHQTAPGRAQTVRDEDGLEWTPIRQVSAPEGIHTVYNIAVEDDESYVVEGIVVHNCRHFSKAKGGQPVSKAVRGLAWSALRYTSLPDHLKPRLLCLENVEEFKDWGPLDADGKVREGQKGRTFRSFVNALKSHGYEVEWRELRACDYGTPTIRKRLFLVARSDGQPIYWPVPTHADPRSAAVKNGLLLPYRAAAECIDWTLPTPSIFSRKKPLVFNTKKRIARGLERFVINAAEPFIVTCNHAGPGFRGQALDVPMRTVTAANDAHGLVTPYLLNKQHGSPSRAVTEPLATVTTNHNKNELMQPALVPCVLDRHRNHTGRSAAHPLSTITTVHNKNELLTASLVKHYGGGYTGPGISPTQPVSTVTTVDHHALLTASLLKIDNQRSRSSGTYPVTDPLPTVVTKNSHAVAVAHLTTYYGLKTATDVRGQHLSEPIRTQTTENRHALTTVFLSAYYSTSGRGDVGQAADAPLRTITTKDRLSPVAATLMRQFGTSSAADIQAPLGTVTAMGGGKTGLITAICYPALSAAQLATAQQVYELMQEFAPQALTNADHERRLVLVEVQGETYILADVGMRMLTPRELARAQGFSDDYILDGTLNGKRLSKEAQVRGVGNSVCREPAAALLAVNLTHAVAQAAD